MHGAWAWLPVAAVAAVLAVAADEQPAIHGEHRRVGDLRGKHGTRRARGYRREITHPDKARVYEPATRGRELVECCSLAGDCILSAGSIPSLVLFPIPRPPLFPPCLLRRALRALFCRPRLSVSPGRVA